MKTNMISRIWLPLSLLASFVAVACSDDSDSDVKKTVAPEDEIASPLDDVTFEDSLYTWFMKSEEKNKHPLEEDSSKPGDDADDGSDDEKDVTGEEEEPDKVFLLPPAGFYDKLTIPVPAALYKGTIRCTYDGSLPTTESAEFEEPYEVSKNTAIRCAEFVKDSVARMSSKTYFIGEKVSMPVVAITVDPYDMFDPKEGYYSQGVSSCAEPCYAANYWKDIELPVHVEFFEEGSSSGKKTWDIDAGLSIIGQWSRYREKKSVSITMRKEYEDGRLKYPLFKTRPDAKRFKAFNLRNNGNRFVGDYIEDPMLTSLLEGTAVDYQRSRQVVVFYNGSYFGIHDMRERLNEHFVETNYGIDSKEVDMVKHVEDEVTASGGTTVAYENLLDAIHSGTFTGSNNKAYAAVSSMMDMSSFAQYMAAEIYIHNGDWPNNNVRAWRTADQPFKFAIFDVDHGFGWDWAVEGFRYMDHNMFSWIKSGGKLGCNGARCFAEIYIKLIQNPDFKRLFINQSAVLLDYYLTYDKVVATTNEMMASIPASEQSRDMSRFPRDQHIFDQTGSSLISYASTRTGIVRDEYRKEFDLGDDISVTIASEGNGAVLLDGMKLPSSSYKGNFFEGNDMLLTAVPAEGAVFASWSDGNKENPRLVTPEDGDKFVAKFK